jgi:phosphoglycolate phosphatase
LIGDTLHDYEVACALGVRCILTEGGHHPPERLRTAGAPVVESAEQVEGYLGI